MTFAGREDGTGAPIRRLRCRRTARNFKLNIECRPETIEESRAVAYGQGWGWARHWYAVSNCQGRRIRQIRKCGGTMRDDDVVGKPWIPDSPVELFRDFAERLRAIHDGIADKRRLRELKAKKRLWLDMLEGSGMAPRTPSAQDRLFVPIRSLSVLRGVLSIRWSPRTRCLTRTGFWVTDSFVDACFQGRSHLGGGSSHARCGI